MIWSYLKKHSNSISQPWFSISNDHFYVCMYVMYESRCRTLSALYKSIAVDIKLFSDRWATWVHKKRALDWILVFLVKLYESFLSYSLFYKLYKQGHFLKWQKMSKTCEDKACNSTISFQSYCKQYVGNYCQFVLF